MIAKKRANTRKTPEIVRFRGFEAMISFGQAEGALICIAPLKKISAENPYDIRGFGIF